MPRDEDPDKTAFIEDIKGRIYPFPGEEYSSELEAPTPRVEQITREDMPKPVMYTLLACFVIMTLACSVSVVIGAGSLAGIW